jgi:hypothetical protein
MERITQSNASETQALSSTAATLSTQAEHLQTLVRRFRVGVEDDAEARPERESPPSGRERRAGRVIGGDMPGPPPRSAMLADLEEF